MHIKVGKKTNKLMLSTEGKYLKISRIYKTCFLFQNVNLKKARQTTPAPQGSWYTHRDESCFQDVGRS